MDTPVGPSLPAPVGQSLESGGILIGPAQVNSTVDNIGARRLHTVLERTLEEVSFDAPSKACWQTSHHHSHMHTWPAARPAAKLSAIRVCTALR